MCNRAALSTKVFGKKLSWTPTLFHFISRHYICMELCCCCCCVKTLCSQLLYLLVMLLFLCVREREGLSVPPWWGHAVSQVSRGREESRLVPHCLLLSDGCFHRLRKESNAEVLLQNYIRTITQWQHWVTHFTTCQTQTVLSGGLGCLALLSPSAKGSVALTVTFVCTEN